MFNTPFHPVSQYGAGIAHLFYIGLVMCYGIFGLVAGLVAFACLRYRARSGGGRPPQIHGNKWAERTWIVAPLLLLVCMFVLTAMTVRDTDPYVPRDHPDVVIIGHQWWWEFRYANTEAVTAYEMHLPVGRKLAARIEAADVIHDFAVNQLGRKMDAIPGYWNYLWLDVNKIGIYPGFCNEFCGAQHAWMQFKVIAQSPDEFTAWLQRESAPAQQPESPDQKRGQQLFQNDTCANCHQIRGTNAHGSIGPDLTHFASRTAIGSGVMANTPEHLFSWLKNPQTIKPGVHMPDMQLNNPDTHALVAYLESLR